MTRIVKLSSGLLLATALSACGSETAEVEQAEPACDRNCLINMTATYVSGLEGGGGAEGLPLAEDLRIVENLERIEPGEGLWRDATGPSTDFGITVPDEIRQTAGWLGMIEREGVPTVVAVRLQFNEDGEISEAEHLYAEIPEDRMERFQSPRPGLTSEVPADSRMDHEALIELGASYYDALDENDGTLTPFAEDCQRHENGMITAGPDAGGGPNNAGAAPRDCEGQLTSNVMAYITSIDNRRVFAADPVTGLVMGLSHFRHPMDFEPYEVAAADGSTLTYTTETLPFEPFDLPAAHILKVGADGLVHEIEAMGFQAPLDSPTGWESEGAGQPPEE